MSSLPNTPVKLQCQENISQDPAHTPTFLRESPWTHKDDNTTNSLFNGLESEIGSLAPSFVPIAASTKRLPATNQSEVDSSSFFVTSSPTPDNNADVIMSDFSLEDDSLYKRVFADTVHASPSSRESRKVNKVLHFDQSDVTLRPEKCMADLQEKLRASEQRRRDVTSKLRHLKSASSNT
uniref:Uncharacterized protein n=1 Tax=Ciona savignyi TaxID=51511 RepID=H2YC90_CIOSA